MRFDESNYSLGNGLPLDPVKGESAVSLAYGPQREASLDYFSFAARHKWSLGLGVLVGLVAGCLMGLLQTPTYRAETSLEVQPVNENFLNLKDVDPTPPPDVLAIDRYIQTQAEILESDGVLDRVIERLNLRHQPEFLPKRSKLDELRSWFGVRVKPPGEVPPIELVKAVRSRLRTDFSHTSRIIRVTYVSRDPELAASFLNVLSDEFSQQNVGSRRTESLEMRSWLGGQLEDLKGKLEGSERALQEYARTSGLTENTTGTETLAEAKLREIQAELLRAQADRISKQALTETARASTNAKDGVPQALDNGALRENQAKLTELRRQLAETSSLLKPENYKVQRIQAQINEIENAQIQELTRARSRAQADYAAAERRETSLRSAYQQQAGVVADQSAKAVRYHILERSAATDKQIYDAMLQRVKEVGVAAVLRPTPIRVISRAKTPATPFKPNLPLSAAVGGFAGLWIGIAAAVFLGQSNRRLRAPGEFEQLLNVPELGAVPNIGRPNRLGAASTLFRPALKPVGLVAWHQSSSDACESFRNIAASILSDCQREKGKRVLLFTSAWPTEGKSTVASNVAVSLAESGRHVLLIDCDLRSPRQQDIFDVPNSWGLRDVLRDGDRLAELPVESLVKPTGIPGLRLLPSGPGVDNITSLLYSPRFGALIERLRNHFDFVLIDAPPLLRFADARIVAGQCDAAVIIHRANMTTQTAAAWTVQRLLAHKIPIAGSILNDCPPDLDNDRYPSSSYYSKLEKRA